MMVKKANEMLSNAGARIRALLLAVASNESLFFFAAFLSTTILGADIFKWYSEQMQMFERYVIMPWGMALCLLRLERRNRLPDAKTRMDVGILFLLVMWVIVPFGIRFGLIFNNVTTWHSHLVAYFGLYAMLTEQSAQVRERRLDQACMLFGLYSLVVGGALMYCAATGATIDSNWIVHHGTYAEDGYGFGVWKRAHLCIGLHYNLGGMMALVCTMFCLAGVSRSKKRVMRVLYLLAAVMMMIVIVLSQSRTARYSLIACLGMGVYGCVIASKRISRAWLRHAAGIALAGVVMVASYSGASALTDAALKHYVRAQQGYTVSVIASAVAQEEAELDKKEAATKKAVTPKKARRAVDATMSGRTDIWRNLFSYWKENPKKFLIGAGMGKIGSLIVEDTIHEENGSVAVHNAYLQYAADYGLMGIGLMALFFLSILVPVLRVFFAPQEKQTPGYQALCMLVLGALMTGMMESSTLGAMTPVNSGMLFALALLAAKGMEMKGEN